MQLPLLYSPEEFILLLAYMMNLLLLVMLMVLSKQALLLTQDSEDSTKYVFSKSLDKVEDFDATKNVYLVTFNNYELMDQVTYTAGSVYIEIPLEFMNTDGELVSDFVVYISVRFLSNSTELELWTFGSDAYSYFMQYVNDFGFRLLIEKTI